MTRIAIVIGSTRPGRRSEAIARWVEKAAARRSDAEYQLVDLADHDLPHLDEPVPAALSSDYAGPHTRRWAETIAGFDGYVFVTPEYNHSTTGVLKNAIDYLYAEWANKSAGFVGYGTHGGLRAVEHLRLIMGELQVADVKTQVALSIFTDFDDTGVVATPRHEKELDLMLRQVVAWAQALAPLREA
jgi:NAD(P)H-dependent FMN reductase